jgi:hypothetical protein
MELVSKTEQRLVYRLFATEMVTLQLDIKPLFKNVIQPCKICEAAAVLLCRGA